MKKKDKFLWNQLSNSINFRSSQDQVLWNIIGTFCATNAILLVALFSQGEPPKNNIVGIVISVVGLSLSIFWTLIQRKALAYIKFFEDLRFQIEKKLKLDSDISTSPNINKALSEKYIHGPSARIIMVIFSMGTAFCWFVAILLFGIQMWCSCI